MRFFCSFRFSGIHIRTVFLLGSAAGNPDLQAKIETEYLTHQDLVQGNFIDSYYNLTLKTMMGLKWASVICSNSKFYFFADDDQYISTRNVIKFLSDPNRNVYQDSALLIQSNDFYLNRSSYISFSIFNVLRCRIYLASYLINILL